MRWITGYLAMVAAIANAMAAAPVKVTPELGDDDASITYISGSLKTAAVSDKYNLLIAGAPGKLQVYPLQMNGNPTSGPTQVLDLPVPPSLQAVASYPLSIAFHPVLPLVYIWQDITSAYASKPEGYKDLCHLAIYRIAGTQLQLVGTYAKGEDFYFGLKYGSTGVTQNGRHILLPNTFKTNGWGIGFYELNEAGLPVVEAGKSDPDPHLRISMNNPNTSLGMINGPNGLLIIGNAYGAVTVDPDIGQTLAMELGPGYGYMAGGNPKKPIYYFMTVALGLLVSLEQVDGYVTQLPRIMAFGGTWSSPPVAMTGKNQLAVGGPDLLLLIDLDADGWPLPKAKTIAIKGTPTQIAYSEKFNRLYVPVN